MSSRLIRNINLWHVTIGAKFPGPTIILDILSFSYSVWELKKTIVIIIYVSNGMMHQLRTSYHTSSLPLCFNTYFLWSFPLKFSYLHTLSCLFICIFFRGFVVESCIVVQHVSRGADNGNSDPPVAKRPCPEVPVNAVNHTTKLWFIILQVTFTIYQ